MQSTISGDICEGLCSQILAKFSDNDTSFTWRLETLVGVNADCRSDVGGTLMICYHTTCILSMYAQPHADQGDYVSQSTSVM